MQTLLDNPIWHALNSKQINLAEGDDLAKRFPINIGPLAGLASQSKEAYHSLSKLAKPKEALVLFLDQPADPPLQDWYLDVRGHLTQMICEAPLPVKGDFTIEPLSPEAIPDMLTLIHLTKPGPFREHTHSLGGYIGIWESGQLVAMAGERLHLEGYTEISAVCTHPDFQGRGYAQALVATTANQILARSEVPFLHTGLDNHHAIRVYEKLGFRQRRVLHLAVLRIQNPNPALEPCELNLQNR